MLHAGGSYRNEKEDVQERHGEVGDKGQPYWGLNGASFDGQMPFLPPTSDTKNTYWTSSSKYLPM